MINTRKNSGITLVTLVITIIVLLILSVVVLNTITGAGGIIANAENVVAKYNESARNEAEELRKAQSVMLGAGGTIEEVKTGETVTARLVADGDGGTFYLPVGFYYVGGTVEDGIVISDASEDNGKYAGRTDVGKTDLVGNQYVWIPVDKRTVVFAQHTYATRNANDTSWLADTGNGNWPTYYYRNYEDWKNKHYAGTAYGSGYENYMDANIASVAKYGGFYIGRYEAGWDTVTADTTRSTNSKPIGDSKIPVSKAGYSAWNHISQVNSSIACDRLNTVEGYENVTARLIDGYAWDTAVEYISDAVSSVTDSRPYGNYYNGTAQESNVIYKPLLYRTAKEGGATSWVYNNMYYRNESNGMTLASRALSESSEADMALVDTLLGEAGVALTNKADYTYRLYYEIVTGGAESTKVKNIYDLAGNMWEWTSEVGGHGSLAENSWTSNAQRFAVLRGGSFGNGGNNSPVSSRGGYGYVTDAGVNIGFRAVLYVK